MSETTSKPNQVSLFEEPEVSQPQESTVLTYDFSAVNSFPSADIAHKKQEKELDDSHESQGMNPGSIGFEPKSLESTSRQSAKTKASSNRRRGRSQKKSPLRGRQGTVGDTNGIRAEHYYGRQASQED